MKKRILFLLLSFCLTVWLFPVTAEAATEITWSEILDKIGDGTQPVSGTGWEYMPFGASEGHIRIGCTVSGEGIINIDYVHLMEGGTISGGTLNGDVNFGGGSSITGGIFNGYVTNSGGSISGGTFNGDVENAYWGSYSDGKITILNTGRISGGTFNGDVLNIAEAIISGGTFTGSVTNKGSITEGTFKGTVKNDGSITGGTFSTYPTGSGTVTGITIDTGNAGSTEAAGTQTESGGSTHHTHHFQWIQTQDPTETRDGVMSYLCGCGHIAATQQISYFGVILNNLVQEIKEAPENGTVTVENEFLRCLSDEMVEALLARPDVTTIIRFTDKGVDYELIIPAGKAPTDGQEWYGYYYLGFLYGWTSIESPGDGSYM